MARQEALFRRTFENFEWFMKLLFYRNLSNYDTMILVSAPKGKGKSSAGISMCVEYAELLTDYLSKRGFKKKIRFDPETDIAYTNNQLVKMIETKPPFSMIIADEAVRFATSEDWNKAENKKLKQLLAQVRTKHLFFILCFPLKVHKLDKVYLESFVDYWVLLMDRGKGALFVKDENPSYDSWRLTEFSKLGNFNEFTDVAMIERRLSKHPNYWKRVNFPKPKLSLFAKYMRVRDKAVYEKQEEANVIGAGELNRHRLLFAFHDFLLESNLTVKEFLRLVEQKTGKKIRENNYHQMIRTAKDIVLSQGA